jgi:hypothetical protein
LIYRDQFLMEQHLPKPLDADNAPEITLCAGGAVLRCGD